MINTVESKMLASDRKSILKIEVQRIFPLTSKPNHDAVVQAAMSHSDQNLRDKQQGYQTSRETKLHQNLGGPIYTGIGNKGRGTKAMRGGEGAEERLILLISR